MRTHNFNFQLSNLFVKMYLPIRLLAFDNEKENIYEVSRNWKILGIYFRAMATRFWHRIVMKCSLFQKKDFFLLSSLNTKTGEYHSPPNHLVKTQRYIFSLILNRSSIFKARKTNISVRVILKANIMKSSVFKAINEPF